MTDKTESPTSPTPEGREEFEAWISAPPYERETHRQGQSLAWPGQYYDYHVQLAWEAWQESRTGLRSKADGA